MNVASDDRTQGVLSAITWVLAYLVVLTANTPALAERVSDGLIALYYFAEGEGTTVHDSSGFGEPIDLMAIAGHQGTRWSWIPGGISIVEPTIIASSAGATKLADALNASDAITVEAWVRPANGLQGTQFDPAEIVTMATGASSSFELFQVGEEFGGYTRIVRNLGNRITAADSVMPGELQHVVYTNMADPRSANLYVDSSHVRSVEFASDLFALDPAHPLAVANRPGAIHPWLGEIHLLAIYDRALSFAEIDQNFRMGPVPEPSSLALLLSGMLAGLLPIVARRAGRARR